MTRCRMRSEKYSTDIYSAAIHTLHPHPGAVPPLGSNGPGGSVPRAARNTGRVRAVGTNSVQAALGALGPATARKYEPRYLRVKKLKPLRQQSHSSTTT